MSTIKNFRGKHSYTIEGVGTVTFTTDKNFSVYAVEPKMIKTFAGEHSALNVVKGQVPDVARNSLADAVAKWNEDELRYS